MRMTAVIITNMGGKTHTDATRMRRTGNTRPGTREYRGYERALECSVEGKPVIPGSADPNFRGDRARYNPEELLVMSLSSCHMLWYLHLCSENHIVVTDYVDDAIGTMQEDKERGGFFTEVVLRPGGTIWS